MIPPEPGPDPPGPDPPEPVADNEWAYDSVSTLRGSTVYVGVDSANGAFVGVVTVGFTGGINWYSDGSLVSIDGKLYPSDVNQERYYDYLNNRIMHYNDGKSRWDVEYSSVIPFDKVPVDLISYLTSGDYTLSPDHQ